MRGEGGEDNKKTDGGEQRKSEEEGELPSCG